MISTHSRDYQRFIDVLIEARKRKNLTQETVAARLGKPQSFVSKYESGERRLDVVEFFQAVKALDEDAFNLLKEMELL